MKKLTLNCDMGEGFGVYNLGLDDEIMPYIDMANLACGFHASDPVVMHRSIKSALANGVKIGAHPSYPDLNGFGRREMKCSAEEIVSFVIYQCGALDALCRTYGSRVTYLKPHGALYNTMMKDLHVFKAICKAVSKYDKKIKLMILSNADNEKFSKIAKKYGIKLLFEVFADRGYNDDGSLVKRGEKGDLLSSDKEVLKRAKLLLKKGVIKSKNGKKLKLKADTLCVHGDNEHALKLIKALHSLKE
ncbi:MAG: 5-oxoprolinase subunit PxpA [Sulfurimonas sp.]